MRSSYVYIVAIFFSFNVQASNVTAKLFSLPDIQNRQKVVLSDYIGKVVYLDFWASWCSSCAKALPLYNAWDKELGNDFVVISVNVDEVKSDGVSMAKKLKLDFPIAYDKSLEIAKMYDVSVLPISFLIDKKGNIHFRHVGFKDSDAKKIKSEIIGLLAR